MNEYLLTYQTDPKMENKAENHMTSAAAFVEGGIQESSDDACSICLEEFNDNDPSTVIFIFIFYKYMYRSFEQYFLTYSLYLSLEL